MNKYKGLALIMALIGLSFVNMNNDNDLFYKLKKLRGQGILFGHQDDLAYGVGWEYIRGESDVKRVAGDYPALFGWELGGLELDHEKNLDKVPFDKMKSLAIMGHEMGGINTFSWHPYAPVTHESSWNKEVVVVKHIIPGGKYHKAFTQQLDKVAVFFQELKDKNGQQIPFILTFLSRVIISFNTCSQRQTNKVNF